MNQKQINELDRKREFQPDKAQLQATIVDLRRQVKQARRDTLPGFIGGMIYGGMCGSLLTLAVVNIHHFLGG